MNNRDNTLLARRMILAKKYQREKKAIRMKTLFFSNLRSELIKWGCKIPGIKNKSESSKFQRVRSPTKLHDLRKRLISPSNRKEDISNNKHFKDNATTVSPIIKKQMFIQLTKDQTHLINKINNKIAETISFRNQGFISPRVLARKFLKDSSLISQRNDEDAKNQNRQLIFDNFTSEQSYTEFIF